MAGPVTLIDKRIGENIRALREARGLTQVALAEKIGVNPSAYWFYEAGQNRVAASTLAKISIALQCPVAALFDGVDGILRDHCPVDANKVITSPEFQDVVDNMTQAILKGLAAQFTGVRYE